MQLQIKHKLIIHVYLWSCLIVLLELSFIAGIRLCHGTIDPYQLQTLLIVHFAIKHEVHDDGRYRAWFAHRAVNKYNPSFDGQLNHILDHIIIELKFQVFYPLALKVVCQLTSSINNVCHFRSLYKLLLTATAKLISQIESSTM